MAAAGPALVIGGGIAGAALAAHLAQAGRAVLLVERRAGPHDKVCGEFISGEAALYLDDLGVDLAALGAVRMRVVRLAARRRMTTVPLPFPAPIFPLPTARMSSLRKISCAIGPDISPASGPS